MTRIKWTQRARAHLRAVMALEESRDPAAAAELARTILRRLALLAEFPGLAPPSQRSTRKLVITGTPYLLIYRETRECVTIVGMWHHALRKRR